MGFIRNRLLRRFSPLGRVADVALVAGFGLRLAQRKGWLTPDQLSRFGLTELARSSSPGFGELGLAGAAALRLLRKRRR